MSVPEENRVVDVFVLRVWLTLCASDPRRLQMYDRGGTRVVAGSLGARVEDQGWILPHEGRLGKDASKQFVTCSCNLFTTLCSCQCYSVEKLVVMVMTMTMISIKLMS